MKSVLIVASEPAPGMIPFAVSMYEIIEKSDKIKPYLIMQNRNYTDYRKHLDNIVLLYPIFLVYNPQNFYSNKKVYSLPFNYSL